MITLYSGTPGAGKSLHLAERVYNRLKHVNKPIIGNFEVNTDKIKGKKKGIYHYWDNLDITPERLIAFSRDLQKESGRLKEGTILLIIDECQIMFNSREWQMSGRANWLSFFTQHRKLGYEIILIAQFDRMIDRQIRSLIEYEYIHRKVNNYGIAGKLLGLFCLGSLFVCVKVWYPMKEKVGSEFFVAHRKYFRIYDSYTLFSEPNV